MLINSSLDIGSIQNWLNYIGRTYDNKQIIYEIIGLHVNNTLYQISFRQKQININCAVDHLIEAKQTFKLNCWHAVCWSYTIFWLAHFLKSSTYVRTHVVFKSGHWQRMYWRYIEILKKITKISVNAMFTLVCKYDLFVFVNYVL